MPPRKTSRPPPYARNTSSLPIPPALKNFLRRDKLRLIVVGIIAFLAVLWLLGGTGKGAHGTPRALTPVPKIPNVVIGSGPPVVIVTVIDSKADPTWVQMIKKNRDDYAKKHGALSP
jgi:mannan polymerase II complex MNN11 subunit